MVGCFFPDFVLFFSRVVIYEVSCKVMYPRFRAAAAVAFFFDAERFTATDNTYEVRGFLVTYIIFLFSIFYNNIIQSIYSTYPDESHKLSKIFLVLIGLVQKHLDSGSPRRAWPHCMFAYVTRPKKGSHEGADRKKS